MLDVSRRELKYLISLADMYSIKKKLSVVMNRDAHNGENGYLVRSLYFDSLYDDVSKFCKKFDYRFQDEPWGTAKDSVERAVKILS